MLTAKDIRDITFSNAVGGYRKDEVDILLDKIEVDYDKYEKVISSQSTKITELEGQIESLKEAQSSIQNVLLSAQKLADQIVDDAKAKSQEIINEAQQNITVMTEKSRQIAEEFDSRASVKKEKLRGEISEIIKNAESKKMFIESAAKESVKNQQELFVTIRKEIAEFKEEIMHKYKEHLEKLSSIPDSVDVDPQTAAKVIEDNFESPELDEDLKSPEVSENDVLPSSSEKAADNIDISSFVKEETEE